MKFDGVDPPRLDEGEPSEFGALVQASRNRRLDAATTAKLAQRLAASGAFASERADRDSRGEARGGEARSNVNEPSAPVVTRTARGYLVRTRLYPLVIVGIGAFSAWQLHTFGEATPTPGPVVTQVAVPAPPEVSTVEPPSVAVEALPALPPSQSSEAPARPVTQRPSTSSSSAALRPKARADDEFALIRSAEAALESSPSRALASAEEHARSFPSGQFVQEREVIAVEALTRLGRTDEAKLRANALLLRFPRAPYVSRLERALGEPLSPPRVEETSR
ncbi:MAG: hypothetical protein K0S65_4454 [Labilithrix sp.]|nr:hypothetical protein [Labilithrix sp.]